MARTLAENAPVPADFRFTALPAPSVVVAAVELEEAAAIPEPAVVSPLVADVPLPMPRPADLSPPANLAAIVASSVARSPSHSTSHPPARAGNDAAPASPDNRSFFEKLFGTRPPPGQALAYAAPEEGFFSGMRRAITGSNPTASYGPNTAVYDIAAHTVYMPDGSRLEAHSGLRERLDDPRFVHERMRGATPPSTYDLKMRETLFHGVQALRLTPLSGSVYGRTGLLAHTYMLGPNGDSNGCVSFRNYTAFLRAYMNGDVKRLVVVPRLI